MIQITKSQKWKSFEYGLNYLLFCLNTEPDFEDSVLLNEVQHSIIVYAMKNEFQEENEIFLNNIKNTFYNTIAQLNKKHPDIKTGTITSFMEEFYFNK